MYSKNKNTNTGGYSDLTPPPGYDGSRLFTRRERSDGRDENFVVHTRPIYRGRDIRNRESEADASPRRSRYGDGAKEAQAPDIIYDVAPVMEEPVPLFSGPEEFLAEEEDSFTPLEEAYPEQQPVRETHTKAQTDPQPKSKPAGSALPEPLAGLLHGLEREDLLLIGLIILLSGEQNMGAGDIVLLLALLLLTK